MKVRQLLKQFNWRFLLVRILVNAIALALTAAVVPKIYFVDKTVGNWLLMAIMLGVLNALIKPVLQFLTLQFLFVTYGLVIVLVNTLILLALSFLFPMRFAVDNLLWAFVGGLALGLFSSFFESLLGLTMPIVPDEPPQLRRQLEEQVQRVDWLATASNDSAAEGQTLAPAPLEAEAKAAEAAVAEPAVPEVAEAEAAAAGADVSETEEVGPGVTGSATEETGLKEADLEPSPSTEVEAEQVEPVSATEVEDMAPEPALEEPQEGLQEDGS